MSTELELLQKIVENTAGDSSLRIALVAGGSAVAGALASALLSYLGDKAAAVVSALDDEGRPVHVTLVFNQSGELIGANFTGGDA